MSRLTKVSIDSVLYDIGSKGINSYATLSELVNEKVSELYDGCIAWCNEESTYYQWLSTNEIISIYGRWRELEFGNDFQITEYVDPGLEKYQGRIIQFVGEDIIEHGFKKGCFYESKLSNTIDYVVASVNESTVGTYYIKDDEGNYNPITFIGDGTGYDATAIYYKKQEVSVYSWVYVNSLKVETEFDETSLNAVANGLITTRFNEMQDYIDTSLEKYTESSVEILQADFDVLTEEEKLANNYHCTDTGRQYYKGVLYGEKKAVILSSQAEYDQMKADGKIEADVDYVIEETDQNINALIGYVPIGVVFPYCATTPPVNYLICDGSVYEKSAYPELYAIIGNAFGGDDTTFAVPNLTDRFIQGGLNVGETKEAGLPNIEGSLGMTDSGGSGGMTPTGAFANTMFYDDGAANTGSGSKRYKVSFDASLSNPIYGASETVQPPSVVLLYIIKCK